MFNNDGVVTAGSVLVGPITLVPLALGVALVVYGLAQGRKARALEQAGERVAGRRRRQQDGVPRA